MKGKHENDGEFKYSATDKEFMAVVRCLKVWKPYLLSSSNKTFVWTDHKPLIHFFSKPAVLDRQVRYLDFLSMFNLEILYIKGKKNLVADALSRKLTLEDAIQRTTADADTLKFEFKGDATIASMICASASREMYTMDNDFLSQIRQAYRTDEFAQMFFAGYNGRPKSNIPSDYPYQNRDGTIWYKQPKTGMLRLYIPRDFREMCMQECHDAPSAGHLGIRKTIERVSRRFHWPHMVKSIQDYIRTCPSCQHNKSLKIAESGLPKPLPIPDERWLEVSMDRAIGLTPSSDGSDAVIVFVYRLSKMAHFVASRGNITSVQYAYAYLTHVYRHHGLAHAFTSDRDSLLTSRFWTELSRLLGIKSRMSTPAHAQTDGQTEVTIRSLKEMIRHFVNEQHNDWHILLPILEFAYNDSVHSSHGYTPFFLNYGRHPHSMIDLIMNATNTDSLAAKEPDTRDVLRKLRSSLVDARRSLHRTQQKLILQLGEARSPPVIYQPGDMVSISIKHFKQESKTIPGRPSTLKFAARYFGPVPIIERVGTNAYRLDLSQDPLLQNLHPVINVSHLRRIYTSDEYRLEQLPPSTVTVDGKQEYVIDRVINDRINKRRKRYEYLTTWKGYSLTKAKWLPLKAFTGSAVKFVQRYLQHVAKNDVAPDQVDEVNRAVAHLAVAHVRSTTTDIAVCPKCTTPTIVQTPNAQQTRTQRDPTQPRYRHLCTVCVEHYSNWPLLTRARLA